MTQQRDDERRTNQFSTTYGMALRALFLKGLKKAGGAEAATGASYEKAPAVPSQHDLETIDEKRVKIDSANATGHLRF